LLALASPAVVCLVVLGVLLWPETYLREARRALDRRDYDQARACLLRYLNARPKSAEAHLLLAQLDRRANNYQDAAKHLDACRRLGGPAEAIKLERALGAIQNGLWDVEQVKVCYEYLSRGDADEYLILEALSQGFLRIYRLDEALACLERMLQLQPDSSFALRRRAWISSQTEQHEQAEADYRRALDVDPEDRAARLGLAEILLDVRQDGPAAAEQFERLWTAQQDSTIAVGLARSWRLIGRTDRARSLLDDWLRRQPGDALALAERGQLALDANALKEAEALLRRAVTLAPYHRDANFTLYLCLTQQGRSDEADACKKRFEEAKNAREQIGVLTRKLRTSPADVDLRCQIAQLFLRYGAEDEGVRWLLTTLQMQPRHSATHRALAEYFAKKGDVARAAEHRRLEAAGLNNH
jgi:predicted Zn-dependent protease